MYIDRSDGQARRIEPARRMPETPYHDFERCANLLRTTIEILDGQRPPKGDRTKALIGRARRPPKNRRHRWNNEACRSTDRAGRGGRARTNGTAGSLSPGRLRPNESTDRVGHGGRRRTDGTGNRTTHGKARIGRGGAVGQERSVPPIKSPPRCRQAGPGVGGPRRRQHYRYNATARPLSAGGPAEGDGTCQRRPADRWKLGMEPQYAQKNMRPPI